MKLCINTNGCSLAQLKSKKIENFFVNNESNIQLIDDPIKSDIHVFWACGLTNQSENGSIRYIKEFYKKNNKKNQFIVCGCLPKINPKRLSRIYNGPMIGPYDLDYFESLLGTCTHPINSVYSNSLLQNCNRKTARYDIGYANKCLSLFYSTIKKFSKHNDKNHDVFYIRISEGCTGNCTYCSEKMAWGNLKSTSIDIILNQFESGLYQGYKRFFLSAEDVGSYGLDIGLTCVDLLQNIVFSYSEHEFSLIIDQITPNTLKYYFRDLHDIFNSGKVESIGCQVQSGSDTILKKMNRKYTVDDWKYCIYSLKNNYPNIKISTHFLIGFPNETNEDFLSTLNLLKYSRYVDSFAAYVYSDKNGTPASRMQNKINEEEKINRYKRIIRKRYINSIVNELK